MNREEFKEYLISIGGLISGWKPDSPPMVEHVAGVGDGWLQLLRDLIQELVEAGWNRQITQIKEKFGGLRFYTGGLTSAQYDIIRKYEQLSYCTCEECGNNTTAKTRDDRYWIRTLCTQCVRKRNKWEKEQLKKRANYTTIPSISIV